MGRKVESFYEELLDRQLVDAINNDFGRAVSRIAYQGTGEVRDEVFVYFSAVAMQHVNAFANKYDISDPMALNELYQLTRTNLIEGFRIGQKMPTSFQPS